MQYIPADASGPQRDAGRPWPPGLQARRCADEDAGALWALFAQPDVRRFAVMDPAPFETPDAVREWLRGSRSGTFRVVGVLDGTLVGFAGLYPLHGRQNHVGCITLAVHEDFRGRGIAAALLKLLLATADRLAGLRRLQLQVLAENIAAITLYEASGFHMEARHPAMVQSGDGYADASQWRVSSESVFEKAALVHGHRLTSVAQAAMTMSVSATVVSCS